MENLENKIELFAKGKLSIEESNELINNASTNLELKSELSYQKYLKKAISEHRKLTLKARLQSIPVSPINPSGVGSGMSTSSILAIKSAAVVVASLGIGAGSYFYYLSKNENNISDKSTQSAMVENLNNTTLTVNKIDNNNITSTKTDLTNSPSIEESTSDAKTIIYPKKQAKSKKNVPNMLAFDDASQSEINSDVDDSPLDKHIVSHAHKISTIEIKTITDSKYNFHYALKENVLTLYGKFEASPYEIIERNNDETSNLYFYYNKNYYSLESSNATIHRLKKLDDKDIISDLASSRENR